MRLKCFRSLIHSIDLDRDSGGNIFRKGSKNRTK